MWRQRRLVIFNICLSAQYDHYCMLCTSKTRNSVRSGNALAHRVRSRTLCSLRLSRLEARDGKILVDHRMERGRAAARHYNAALIPYTYFNKYSAYNNDCSRVKSDVKNRASV